MELHKNVRPFNVTFSSIQRLECTYMYSGTCLVHRSNFGQMPFLTPPVTHRVSPDVTHIDDLPNGTIKSPS